MSTYSDGLWVTATTDEAANSFDQIVSTAFVETAGVGAVLVAASSQADFDNRLALSEGSLRSIVAKVAPESAEAVLGALVDRWASQWRTAQMQRQAGIREILEWGKGLFLDTPTGWDGWLVRAGEFIAARDFTYSDGEVTATNGPDALHALAGLLMAAKAAGVTSALELQQYGTLVAGLPGITSTKRHSASSDIDAIIERRKRSGMPNPDPSWGDYGYLTEEDLAPFEHGGRSADERLNDWVNSLPAEDRLDLAEPWLDGVHRSSATRRHSAVGPRRIAPRRHREGGPR